jgi:AcrR family transcriptional regulator
MQDICREARLSPGAIYNYFDGKNHIIRALAEMGKTQIEGVLLNRRETMPLNEVVRQSFEIIDNAASIRTFQLDVRLWGEAFHDRHLREIFQSSRENLLTIFTQSAQRTLGDSDKDAAVIGRLLILLTAGLELEKAMNPETQFDQLIPLLNKFVSVIARERAGGLPRFPRLSTQPSTVHSFALAAGSPRHGCICRDCAFVHSRELTIATRFTNRCHSLSNSVGTGTFVCPRKTAQSSMVVEELYFRGYLLPRISRFGGWAPVINCCLFALYHFWQPFNLPSLLGRFASEFGERRTSMSECCRIWR